MRPDRVLVGPLLLAAIRRRGGGEAAVAGQYTTQQHGQEEPRRVRHAPRKTDVIPLYTGTTTRAAASSVSFFPQKLAPQKKDVTCGEKKQASRSVATWRCLAVHTDE